ncbi:hypothetical protein WT15_19675 [Burkholderia stagnalis]|uniref:class I SAM-dependent methyltransferase n=1 Tax=Burkholderia stagnalis TaxID=1503054 RepID=UPI0007566208|nr:class I SAM-dependent methyltransferase [Burkholderia stagnalis]AOK53142.1 hypothetical protein WT74_10815 [Burkholderia stagnalis]KVN77162.1 hypothetical protein WT15_19675 [Burkholderia stagnalis]KWO34074.1 hypothetical protein WT96_20385 [Burkholderia stagnalis]KWO41454.1 hypothetical protein WT95_02860 [Burkholderia stagnalis]
MSRLHPPIWRHDAYVLRRLANTIGAVLDRHLSDSSGHVADIGAGDAPYRSLFEQKGFDYLCLDLAESKCDLIIEPGQPLPVSDESIAVVTSFQVLEHVWDLDWYLSEARRILARNGKLVLSTHGVWLYHPHPGDYRRWTRNGLVSETESRSFRVCEIVGAVGPLAWTTLFRSIGMSKLLSRIPAVGALLSAFFCGFGYLRMAFEDRITPSSWKQDNAAVYVVVAEPLPGNGPL